MINQLAAITSQESLCETISSSATIEGYKQWCWKDPVTKAEVDVASTTVNSWSNGGLGYSVHYFNDLVNYKPVEAIGRRLQFTVDHTSDVPSGSQFDFNYRSEIWGWPSTVDHPSGTEQWWGFDYRFDENYIPTERPWIMWQTHQDGEAPIVPAPMVFLEIAPTNYSGEVNDLGALFVSNSTIEEGGERVDKKTPTSVVPIAGQTLRVVIKVIWGSEGNGLYQVWVDDVLIYDEQERTTFLDNNDEGGFWKIGVYISRWQQLSEVNASIAEGVSRIQTSIGTLKQLMRFTTHPDYGNDEYNTVKP